MNYRPCRSNSTFLCPSRKFKILYMILNIYASLALPNSNALNSFSILPPITCPCRRQSLFQLANELINTVILHVDDHDTLRSVAHIWSHLQDLVEPILYRYIFQRTSNQAVELSKATVGVSMSQKIPKTKAQLLHYSNS